MKLPEITFKHWMANGELAKLAKVLYAFWHVIAQAIELPLKQHDLLTCSLSIVDLLAWERGIERLEKEDEALYRLRVQNAFLFCRSAGEIAGFRTIFGKLGVEWFKQTEREQLENWDVIKIETSDNSLAQKDWLMSAMIRKYGRTCRRYRFEVVSKNPVNIRCGTDTGDYVFFGASLPLTTIKQDV